MLFRYRRIDGFEKIVRPPTTCLHASGRGRAGAFAEQRTCGEDRMNTDAHDGTIYGFSDIHVKAGLRVPSNAQSSPSPLSLCLSSTTASTPSCPFIYPFLQRTFQPTHFGNNPLSPSPHHPSTTETENRRPPGQTPPCTSRFRDRMDWDRPSPTAPERCATSDSSSDAASRLIASEFASAAARGL